ncbi:Pre-mRNA-splicing factor CWC22 [Leucoagaricus sp. SymC.cos]|nr:Pre-mRNA-splicing factor CWC22 [Leucoagaricus sp. SymC.cos]
MSAADLKFPREDGTAYKRKRSRSPSEDVDDIPPASRRRSRSPASKSRVDLPRVTVNDVDPVRKAEREPEFAKLTNTRSGGVYIPPARLRAMQAAAAQDKSSPEYQRISWDALRKSITGIVNRVNIANIKQIAPELFAENLIRGRGLFARSIMKAQAASLPFTPVFAAVVAIINTKLPQVGELVLTRLISQFRRAFKRNDKIICHSSTTFIAHLVNQAVAHEIIALQILVLLLERPTDDSIEIAVGFMREVGAFLTENSPKANATVYERFRAVLNEGSISQRVQYMIEVLMQVRKDKYKDNPIIPEGLDLVEEDDQITHQIQLEEELQVQDGLNIFKFDPNYLENEEKYKAIRTEIVGEDSDEEGSTESGSEDDSEDEDVVAEKEGIEDRTQTNLVNLRRVIYLTIMNALNYEEAVHKLLKVQLDEGQEIELINMIIECCSQERSKDPEIRQACQGMFPMDVPKNTRFSINYFTSIGLGILTEEMREYLKNAPRLIMEQRRAMLENESSDSDSDSDSDTDSSDSDTDSDASSDVRSSGSGYSRRRHYSSSPPRRRARSYSRSVTPPRRRGGRDGSRSLSPLPRRGGPGRGRNGSRSPSPPSRRRGRDDSVESSPRRRRDDSRTPPSPPTAKGYSRAGGPGRRYSRSPSVSRSRSRSPPPPPRRRYDSPPRRGGRSPSPPPHARRDPRAMDTRPDGPSRRAPDSPPPPRRRRSPSYTRGGGDRRMRSASRSPSPPSHRRDRSPPPPRRGAGDRDWKES